MKLYHNSVLKEIRMLTETNRLATRINDDYFSKNILLQWIFWKRVHIILNMAARTSNPDKVLDFIMGWGVRARYIYPIPQTSFYPLKGCLVIMGD